MTKRIHLLALVFCTVGCIAAQADQKIDMEEVRQLSKLSVNEILKDSPVKVLDIENYWSYVHGRRKPLVVFFYSNIDDPSQRVTTLIKYIAPDYTSRISFARFEVTKRGQPDKAQAKELATKFGLDQTPGILYYDNVGTKMMLEEEDYVKADFKEFRTPVMFLWKTYYSAVRKELDKLLAD